MPASRANGQAAQPDGLASAPPPPAQRDGGSATSSGDGKKMNKREGKIAQFKAVYNMAHDNDMRRARSLNLTHVLAYSLVIVGAIFLGLTLGGNYPAPKAELQADGVYTESWVKYVLYIAAGVGGIAAVLLANRALAAGRNTTLAQLVLLLTAAAILSTVGLTIYLLTLDLGYSWWSYLLNALMLIQRLLYLMVSCMALYTLREAEKDEAVAGHVAQAQGLAEAKPAAAPYNGADYSVV